MWSLRDSSLWTKKTKETQTGTPLLLNSTRLLLKRFWRYQARIQSTLTDMLCAPICYIAAYEWLEKNILNNLTNIYEVSSGMTIFCACTIISAALVMFPLRTITACSLWLHIITFHCPSLLYGVNIACAKGWSLKSSLFPSAFILLQTDNTI
jgi:hypothetical protein